MFDFYGRECPATGGLVANACSGRLVTVHDSFPGARRTGPLFPTTELAREFRHEALARACECLAGQCKDDGATTTGRYLQAEQCLEAARLCRLGVTDAAVVMDVVRLAGPVAWEYETYGMTLPAGAVDG
jgi:hypothetical protein